MARGLPRRIWQMIIILIIASFCVGTPHKFNNQPPRFDSLDVIGRTEYSNQNGKYWKVEFKVRGDHIYRGMQIKTTKTAAVRNSVCGEDVTNFNISEVWAEFDKAHFVIQIPQGVQGKVYFCLPRQAVNDDIINPGLIYDGDNYRTSDNAWYHQGEIAISLDSNKMSADPDTDLRHNNKQMYRSRRQFEQIDANAKVRVTGLRVDVAGKEPHCDEQGAPYLIAGDMYTLRLFGKGFSENMVITLTQQKGNYGGSCQIPATRVFEIVKDSFTLDSVQVAIKLPTVEADEPFYICVKEGNVSFVQKVTESRPFVHQGSDPWISVYSYQKMVPIWAAIVIICVCLCFSALFSGLNLGLMSLDRTELKILCNTGTNKEKQYAKTIQPVRNHGNYLLCSILLGNVLVNSTFTILLDDLTSGVIAVVFSTLAIVMFGEITPQAICSRHGLAVGAKTILITKMVMAVTFPLSYPISKLLDVCLGEEIGSVYTRERLKELVKYMGTNLLTEINKEVTTGENDLDKDEVNIISGALELRKKTVSDVMTKIEDAFMLDYEAILDFETVSEIMKSGYSRIPVFENDRKNIVTTLYIKDLAFVDPDDNTPLKTLCQFYQNPCNFVSEHVTLDVMFKDFKEGNKGHMAFVNRVNTEGEGEPFFETIGLITLEDVIEELIQAEIMDETDVFTDNRTKRRRNADRTKQDFTVFADRRGESNRIRISPQLTLATYQYLSTSVDFFKPDNISETILRRLLKQDIVHHLKKNKDWRNDPGNIIYQRGKAVDYFVLILEGRVEVTVGQENLTFDSGPFTFFGTQALIQNIGVAAESPSTIGSLQSLNMDSMFRYTFQPDYTVRACTELLYMKVRRNLYMAARRASLMEKSQRGDTTQNTINADQFDDEVEKLFLNESDDLESRIERSSLVDAEKVSQLLHSLEEDCSIECTSPEPKQNGSHLQTEQNPLSAVAQNARKTSIKTHISPTTGMRSAFGPRDLNGSIKHSSNMDDISSGKEEEVSLLPKKS